MTPPQGPNPQEDYIVDKNQWVKEKKTCHRSDFRKSMQIHQQQNLSLLMHRIRGENPPNGSEHHDINSCFQDASDIQWSRNESIILSYDHCSLNISGKHLDRVLMNAHVSETCTVTGVIKPPTPSPQILVRQLYHRQQSNRDYYISSRS